MSSSNIAQVLNPAPLTLSEATLVDAITALAKIADEEVLDQVVKSLDPQRDIPPILLSPLKELEAKSRYSLIALFVTHRFTAISEGTLQSLLKGRNYVQLMDLWDLVMESKQEPLAQQVLSLIIQQKLVFSSSEPGENKVLNWLNGTSWDDESDQKIVDDAIKGSHDILFFLERAVPKDKISRVIAPDVRAAQTKSSTQPLTGNLPVNSPPASDSQAQKYRGNWPLVTLSALVMLAIYFAVPFDLPNNVTLVFRLVTRLLELGYVYSSAVALAALLIGIIGAIVDGIDELGYWLVGVLIALAIAGACFAAQYFWFRLDYTFWGQVALIVLAGLNIAVPVVVWYASRRLVST